MSFWERRLGGQDTRPLLNPDRPGQIPSHLYPGGLGPAQQQQAVQQYVQQLPAFQGAPPQADTMEVALQVYPTQGDRTGAASKDNLGPCPSCGSFRYMARVQGSVTTSAGVVAPRPQCFDCGYPSEQGSLGIAAKAQGPAHSARQGAMMPFTGLRPPGS